MKRIIDLSHPITDAMPVFPGDPEVDFTRVKTIKESGYNVTRVCMGTHTGTHIDVPSHCMYDDHAVDSLSLDDLVGKAEVLDLGELAPKTEIRAAHLDIFEDRITEGARILLKTGWSKRFGRADYFTNFPGISEGAATWIKSRKIKLIGVEQPSVHAKDHVDVHKTLLAAGVIVIEAVANLDKISQESVYLVALPINFAGLDGAPARVIAIEGADASEEVG